MIEKISEDIVNNLLQEMGEVGICFYPGGFKPPHKGHFAAAEWLASKPNITSVCVLIGQGIREGINAEQSQDIWNKYLSYHQPSKINAKISNDVSPIKDIFKYVQSNPNQKIYLAIGEGEDIHRFRKLENDNHNVEVIKIPVQFNRISGTETRKAILNNDKEKFINSVPDFVVDKEEIFVKLTTVTLNEISDKVKKQVIAKFHEEKPDIGLNIIAHYVNRFEQLQNSPHVTQKDITKYNWKELERVVDSAPVKSTQKKDSFPISEDSDLIYNENELRIYKGNSKKACVKYGNGYSWCISARGEGNMYGSYVYGEGGTPYFVFDDERSHEKEKGVWEDPNHAIVIIHFDTHGNTDGMDWEGEKWTVTNANNDGDKEFDYFGDIERIFPKLKGLSKLFTFRSTDPQEKKEYEIINKYNENLYDLNMKHLNRENSIFKWSDIENINIKLIDELLNNKLKIKIAEFFAEDLSPSGVRRAMRGGNNGITLYITYYYIDENEVNQRIERYRKNLENRKDIGDHVSIKTYDEPVDDKMREYLTHAKNLYFSFKNELNKIYIKESSLPQNNHRTIVEDFVSFVCELLDIKNRPEVDILDKPIKNGDQPSFGAYDPNNHHIMVCFGNRHLLDALRTLAHEMTHFKQNENGEIKDGDGNTGSKIENEANTTAGIIMREYGKLHPELF